MKSIQEMRELVGTKEPVEYFSKLTDVLQELFNRLDVIDSALNKIKMNSVLAVHWEPKVAADMLSKQIEKLRKDKELYHNELYLLKTAFMENKVTQNYEDFCSFWFNALGFHPFLD